jgi:hypothetical protein
VNHFNVCEQFAFAEPLPQFAALARGFVLFRAHSPKGKAAGLWLERNPDHPKIWGWIVGAAAGSPFAESVGAMVVVERHQGEALFVEASYDTTRVVYAMPEKAVQLVIDPPIIPLRKEENHVNQ